MTAPPPLHILPRVGEGIYTLPDAALILNLPLSRLRSWVGGYLEVAGSPPPGMLATCGRGTQRAFNFHVLIEAYTVYQLRELGVTMQRIRQAREVLAKTLGSPYPFASKGILAQGGKVLFDIRKERPGALLNLDASHQTEFQQVISPFCKELDFEKDNQLANRYWPMGRSSSIVIDPRISFGRPVIADTGITVETLSALVEGGESPADISAQFDVPISAVIEADRFIRRVAA